MKTSLKIVVLFIFIALSQAFVFSMEQKISEQLELPAELNTEIFKLFINKLLEAPRSFTKLKKEILNLRLSNPRINNALDSLFTENFIKNLANQINNSSEFPISSYQLAKILLNKEQFEIYKQKYKAEADRLGQIILKAINTSGQPRFNVIKSNIQAGANMDFTDKDGYFPLYMAAYLGINLKEIELLINSGANVALDRSGRTVLDEVLQQQSWSWRREDSLVKLLIDAGAPRKGLW